MGTDNLHHKRKAKKQKDIRRNYLRRKSKPRILIVCEGTKTEPNYFSELKYDYRLTSAEIEINGLGSDPLTIYMSAKKRFNEEKENPFDRVYCVFDKDSHPTYQTALKSIRNARPMDTFVAINSVPCFEYWLLLHYDFSTKPYVNSSGSSACDQVLNDLKVYMPSYRKGDVDLFSQLSDKMNFAMKNAEKGMKSTLMANTDNPSTNIYKLVSHLQGMKGI